MNCENCGEEFEKPSDNKLCYFCNYSFKESASNMKKFGFTLPLKSWLKQQVMKKNTKAKRRVEANAKYT